MICNDYKCIFIHIPKCAGQSVEYVFLDLVGLSWETRAPLLLRAKEKFEFGPPRLAHLKAFEYTFHNYISQDQFKSYFKFAFVRNPWDRMVSIYKYSYYSQKYDFPYFVKHIFKPKMWGGKQWFVGPQYEFVYDKAGNLLVDFLGKFENLQEDFFRICSRLGLPNLPLKHINKSAPGESDVSSNFQSFLSNLHRSFLKANAPKFYQDFHEYYDGDTIKIVSDLYKRDIELFSYKFE